VVDTKALSRTLLGMTLFKHKITLVVTYGMELILHHRAGKKMEMIEKTKGSFLKKGLLLSKYSSFHGHGNFFC
jgi:hypothetical protein